LAKLQASFGYIHFLAKHHLAKQQSFGIPMRFQASGKIARQIVRVNYPLI
jgi:hypothetical protein